MLKSGIAIGLTFAALLQTAAELLATGQQSMGSARIFELLQAREQLQSTGVGGGVAVPHATHEQIEQQVAALLVCNQPVAFDAIDGEPVSILFALIGPKGRSAQHLKTLAQVSRLLRPQAFRDQLARAHDGGEVYALLSSGNGSP